MNKSVLIVDDEQPIRDLLTQALQDMGFDPVAAASGQEALEMLEQQNILVMVLDLNMPGLNGLELARLIRQAYPLAQLLALTGYRSLFQLSICREAGFDDYFVKPVNLTEINQALSQAFTRLERWRKY